MFPSIVAVALYCSLLYVCGRYTAKYAASRGRSKAVWFVLGCLFYPLPSVVLAVLPRSGNEQTA
jgi:hypothetical protein